MNLPREFELHLTMHQESGDQTLPVGNLSTDQQEPAPGIFHVVEGQRFSLRLRSSDPTATCTIEGIDQRLHAGSEQPMSVGGRRNQSDAFPWFPGSYEVQVRSHGQDWYGLFEVRPKLMQMVDLHRLRQDLDGLVAGLSLDLEVDNGYLGRSRGPHGPVPATGGRLAELQVLKQALTEVGPALRQIAAQPQRRLGSEYKVLPWHRARRLDGKSFQWLVRGRWLQDPQALPGGEGSSGPRRVLAPQSRPSYDTYENRVIARILGTFVARAAALLAALQKDRQYARAEQTRARASGWETSQWDARSRGFDELLAPAQAIAEGFRRLQAQPFLSEVPPLTELPRPTVILQKDARYRTLFEWYRRLAHARVRGETRAALPLRAKRTSLLYEYWCLLRVLDLLRALGFGLRSGWLAQQLRRANRDRIIPVIPEGEQFWLAGPGNRQICVAYDAPLLATSRQAREAGHEFYLAGYHNRPDLRLDLYRGDQFLRSLVLDAKYRPAAQIWHEVWPRETMRQLQSYAYTLFRSARPGVRAASMAIALYPGRDRDPAWQTHEDGNIALARLVPGVQNSELAACFRAFVEDETT